MPQNLSSLSVGAKIKYGTYQVASETPQPIIWNIVAKGYTGYPANAITCHAEKIIDLRCFDAKEPTNPEPGRAAAGNNRYIYSNIHQWLNKYDAAGSWYVAQHDYDQSPTSSYASSGTQYDSKSGFLNLFTTDERNGILASTITTNKANVDGGGTDTFDCKVFLPTYAELISTGWGFYTTDNSRKAYLTTQAYNSTLSSSKPAVISSAWTWWTRSPQSTSASSTTRIDSNGSYYGDDAWVGYHGIRPVINLDPTIKISDTTDADGCYYAIWNNAPSIPSSITVPSEVKAGQTLSISWGTSTDPDDDDLRYILERSADSGAYVEVYRGVNLSYVDNIDLDWDLVQYRACAIDEYDLKGDYVESDARTVTHNQAPTISGSDSNLGTKTGEFSISYTIDDADDTDVTAYERIDGVLIRSYQVTLEAENNLLVTGTTWLRQTNGPHTLTITAVDDFGNSTIRTYTFTKSVNSFSVQNSMPFVSDTQPVRIKISVTKSIPVGSTFTVYVCNNGYDATPTWEDATSSVTGGLVHNFTNDTKTAESWGVIVKVEVERGSGEGACYVSQIGGNFE